TVRALAYARNRYESARPRETPNMAIETALQQDALTYDQAMRRTRELVPRIRERALRCERERRVPRETIDEFVGAGLLRTFTPKRWGGYEISHDLAADII